MTEKCEGRYVVFMVKESDKHETLDSVDSEPKESEDIDVILKNKESEEHEVGNVNFLTSKGCEWHFTHINTPKNSKDWVKESYCYQLFNLYFHHIFIDYTSVRLYLYSVSIHLKESC